LNAILSQLEAVTPAPEEAVRKLTKAVAETTRMQGEAAKLLAKIQASEAAEQASAAGREEQEMIDQMRRDRTDLAAQLTAALAELTAAETKIAASQSERTIAKQTTIKDAAAALISDLEAQDGELQGAIELFDTNKSTAGDAAFNAVFAEMAGKQAQLAELEG
jgi:small-conductance mechanosensitive channel